MVAIKRISKKVWTQKYDSKGHRPSVEHSPTSQAHGFSTKYRSLSGDICRETTVPFGDAASPGPNFSLVSLAS